MGFKLSLNFKDHVPEVESSIAAAVSTAVKKGARIMERNIKMMATTLIYATPAPLTKSGKVRYKRTGNLRRGIIADENVGPFQAEVRISPTLDGADTNYAAFVEYGTSRKVARPFIRQGVKVSEQQITEEMIAATKSVK